MWIYCQSTGTITAPDGKLMAIGYAGVGAGKNNPALQQEHAVGPLPRGLYQMQPPVDTATHGPYVLWLIPDGRNEMFGRGDFGIHGDSWEHPGLASLGCIVAPKFCRQRMWESGDHVVAVVGYQGEAIPEEAADDPTK
jgi:Protein of unknown function (DUF2778)